MKIAICFSGQIRTGIACAPSILRYIGNLLSECDFFVHTWDINTDPNKQKVDDVTVLTSIDKSVFSDFYRLYNPIAMVVEPYHLRKVSPQWGGARIDAKTQLSYVSMFESIYEANKLKMLHEQKHHFVYDRVIRIRADLTFHPSRSLRDDLISSPIDDQTFVSEYHKGGGGSDSGKLEDIYWIASSPVMDKICDFNEIRANSSDPLDWQVQMANWAKSPDMGLRFQALKSQYPIRILRTAEINLDTISDWDKIPPN
jgi:hypothetical protein